MAAKGTALIDFGAWPGCYEAKADVTDPAVTASTVAECYFMADSTADHTADDHCWIASWCKPACGSVVAGKGFTIYAKSSERMNGTFQVRWIWV